MRIASAVVAFAAAIAFAVPAQATLLTGQVVTWSYDNGQTEVGNGNNANPAFDGNGTVTVTPPGTFEAENDFSVIVSDNSITITALRPPQSVTCGSNCEGNANFTAFLGFIFYMPTAPALTGVTADKATNLTGFSAVNDLEFSAHVVYVDLNGVDFTSSSSQVVIDLTTAPEPASGALLLVAVGGVRYVRRRRGPHRG